VPQWQPDVIVTTGFPEPLGPRIVEFHRLFHHRVPTDAQVSALLRSAGLPR
jgi:hypothetical protein